jgi:pilus assembly protein Flp/PilA
LDAIRTVFRTLRADRRGATAIEYGLIVGLIAIATITGMSSLGGGVGGKWGGLANTMNTYMP